jgi:hypothetical protein
MDRHFSAFFSDNTRIIYARTVYSPLDSLVDIASRITILAFKYLSLFFIAVLMVTLDDCFCENSWAAMGRELTVATGNSRPKLDG